MASATSTAAVSIPLARHTSSKPVEAKLPANLSQIGAGSVPSPCCPTEGTGAPNLSTYPWTATLPSWASTPDAIAILARILDERPDTRCYDNGCSAWGGTEYAGRNAKQLRAVYDGFLSQRLAWAEKPGHATPQYHKRRDAVVAYGAAHGPDALIGRLLAQWVRS